ncbi:MAG: hypothetical protein COA43_02330 [Robiginitomaculum sp.]|nr:MAG: hypothetical protein COA43_02330 [Robiginitomaculum sp.]
MLMNIFMSGFKHALVGLSLMAIPLSASAQFVSGSNASTIITADRAEYQGDVTILTGQVDVRQDDVRILADKMVIKSSSGISSGVFSEVTAEGNFYYLTSEQEVKGQRGVYTKTNDTFVVTGDVVLKQASGNVVTGDKLYYNIGTKNARVVGTCKGRKCGSKGRVNILIKNSGGSGS